MVEAASARASIQGKYTLLPGWWRGVVGESVGCTIVSVGNFPGRVKAATARATVGKYTLLPGWWRRRVVGASVGCTIVSFLGQ